MAKPQISLVNLPVVLTDLKVRNLTVKNNESDHNRKLVMSLLNKPGRELLDSLHNPEFAKKLLPLSNGVDSFIEHIQLLHELALQARDRCTLMCAEFVKIQAEAKDYE